MTYPISFRRTVIALAALLAGAASAGAQRASVTPDSLAGTWHGTSICTTAGKPSCHDEVVVYHMKVASARDSLEWVMNKVVGGKEETMGTLTCGTDATSATVRCPMRDWMWTFHADAKGLHGTLANGAGTVWRHIEVSRRQM